MYSQYRHNKKKKKQLEISIINNNNTKKDISYIKDILEISQNIGLILNNDKNSYIFTNNELVKLLENKQKKQKYSILACTLKNNDNEKDITEQIQNYLFLDQIINLEKLHIILKLHNIDYNENSVLEIIDNYAENFKIKIKTFDYLICESDTLKIVDKNN